MERTSVIETEVKGVLGELDQDSEGVLLWVRYRLVRGWDNVRGFFYDLQQVAADSVRSVRLTAFCAICTILKEVENQGFCGKSPDRIRNWGARGRGFKSRRPDI
jgi:hypothetical protein